MNNTSVAVFSQDFKNNGEAKDLQPIATEDRLEINLSKLVGLDPMSTVYMSVEMAFAADRACFLEEISVAQRDLIKEALEKLVDNTKGNPWFPW